MPERRNPTSANAPIRPSVRRNLFPSHLRTSHTASSTTPSHSYSHTTPTNPAPRILSHLSPVVQPLPQLVHLPKLFVWTTHLHFLPIPHTPTIAMPISILSLIMDMKEMEVGTIVPCRSMARRI
ncbi:putative upf0220 domain protein [Botrytis fragariae]|uniref:Putative upf0220 domain protein n=1 Tax=Botrytis fragariae TaxID=1964551 RepID=A0A8H6AP87_9HELO|nr:putative upf0220 domain protein [Botrytis fragariae]KAF5871286.1 putative upf0220 domain protein [Botrytis fragariae]